MSAYSPRVLKWGVDSAVDALLCIARKKRKSSYFLQIGMHLTLPWPVTMN